MRFDSRPDPVRSREALKAQLRAIPQPPVPGHLEARLLTNLPVATPIRPRRWAVSATRLVVASAACMTAVLLGRLYLGDNRPAIPVPRQPAQERGGGLAFGSPSIAAWREDPRSFDEKKLPAYTWPFDEKSIPRASTSIPADLFE